jgi:hypothetical protein
MEWIVENLVGDSSTGTGVIISSVISGICHMIVSLLIPLFSFQSA